MIVTCPVCHNETFDNGVTCSHCGWKYDGITHELEISPINGYVCFYDYSFKDANGNASNTQVISAELSFNYVQTIDYLNTFRTSGSGENAQILYSGNYTDSIVLSYYDTFMSADCYSVRINNEKYSLTLTTNAEDVISQIKDLQKGLDDLYKTVM